MTTYKNTLQSTFVEISNEIDSMTGVIIAEFSKEAAMNIGEAWAWKVIDLIIDGKMHRLKTSTIQTRENRNIYILDSSTPLLETGQLLESIEVIYKHTPHRADVLELGIRNTALHTSHGRKNAPSMKTLAAWMEYGFTAKGTSVKPRPVFKQAALEIGYEAHRMLKDEWNYFIRGRTMQRLIKGGSIVATGARSGYKSSHKSDVGFTAVGKIYRNGSSAEFYFKWDIKPPKGN